MPEISDAELRQFVRYQSLGTPEELDKAVKKTAELEEDNKKQRDEIRDLKAKVPAEGAVVLAGDEAKKWGEVKDVDVDGLTKKAEKADTLESEIATRDRRDAIRAAVAAMGWPEETADTLMDLRSLDGATFEVKTEKVRNAQGKDEDQPVPYITLSGEGKTPQKLAEYAPTVPQLKGLRTEPATSGDRSGPRYPEQRRGDPPKERDIVGAQLNSTYVTPSQRHAKQGA